MLKTLAFISGIFALSSPFPAIAQEGSFTTNNDVINAMMHDWEEYDMACRGASPSEADSFCGARDYIGFALGESGVCRIDVLGGEKGWETCKEESHEFADPLEEVRETF